MATPLPEQWRLWIAAKRKAASRSPKHYATMDQAVDRMRMANGSLSAEQARHLTFYGTRRNEDGSWSWKFDPDLYVFPFLDIPPEALRGLWGEIACPTLLLCGDRSFASNPEKDGRVRYFRADTKVVEIADAGHWLHHDQCATTLREVVNFI